MTKMSNLYSAEDNLQNIISEVDPSPDDVQDDADDVYDAVEDTDLSKHAVDVIERTCDEIVSFVKTDSFSDADVAASDLEDFTQLAEDNLINERMKQTEK